VSPRRLGALAAAFLLSLVGAAEAAERHTFRITSADQTAARAIGLRTSDFAGNAGWKGGPTERDPDGAITCPNLRPRLADLVVTGAAASSFQYGGVVHVGSEVWLMRTARMAALDWQRIVAKPGYIRCHRAMLSRELERGQKLVSLRKLSFPRVAPRTAAYRAVIRVRAANGKAVRVLNDVVLLDHGRTEISLSLTAPYSLARAAVPVEARLARAMLRRAARSARAR
jgi:hypothetical protein